MFLTNRPMRRVSLGPQAAFEVNAASGTQIQVQVVGWNYRGSL
jgi:hypothetical protein